MAAVEANPDPVQWFVLNAEANVDVDLTDEAGEVFDHAQVVQAGADHLDGGC